MAQCISVTVTKNCLSFTRCFSWLIPSRAPFKAPHADLKRFKKDESVAKSPSLRQARLAARGLGFKTLWTNTSTSTRKSLEQGAQLIASSYFQKMEKSGLGLQPYWNLRSMPHGPDLTLPGLKLQIISTSCDCFPTSCDFSVACAPARIKTSKVRAISGT